MSARELERGRVLAAVAARHVTLGEAAAMLGVSYRQAKRLWRRYRRSGVRALQHRLVGRPSNRSFARAVRARVLDFVLRELGGRAAHGAGQRFGPTLAAEHVADELDVSVSVTTLRRWMREAKMWSPRRSAGVPRARRERSEHFGELVQLDGSPHA